MCSLQPYLLLSCSFVTAVNMLNNNMLNNSCCSLESYRSSSFFIDSPCCYHNPDVLSNVTEIAKRHEYNVTTYEVITEDGYVLTVFRILSANVTMKKAPVFIQHGILTNSGFWVSTADRSLAFNLVDLGYDVWLGNLRGTTYSKKHVSLKVSDLVYWKYNLDTLAKNDIRSQLKLVANHTGNNGNIIYIGHSMGTSLSFMYCSEYPEEAHGLIQGLIALAPVAYLDTVQIINLFRPITSLLVNVLEDLQINGILYQDKFIHQGLNIICRLLPDICYLSLQLVAGATNEFLPNDLLLFFSYWPAGVSIYNFRHYLQIAESARFQKYDFGERKNREIYGTPEPPVYNLSKIIVPTYLYYGKTDNLYNHNTLHRLFNELGSIKKTLIKQVPLSGNNPYFNHADFQYAKNIKNDLYQGLFNTLQTEFDN